MQFKMFSIRDNKAQVFMPPFHSHNQGTAIRSIQQNMQDPNSSLAAYPADFSLYEIATFDDDTGDVVPTELNNLGLLTNFQLGE